METDSEEAAGLLKTISEKCKSVTAHVEEICAKGKKGEVNTSKGISFLEVKYQLLLSYLINLTYLLLKKTHGQTIAGEPAVDMLVELRTVLEKMRPIDQKLKYQVDKVIRIATTGGADSNDPMRFKANPEALESKLSGEESSDSDSDREDKKSKKLYRPPKLAAVRYDEDETTVDKKTKQMEHLKKRALNSDIMQELKDQYYEGPQEIRETRDQYRLKEDRKAKERQEFEEDNFIRLMLSKKEKQAAAKQKRVATVASLGNLTQFDSISALDTEGGNTQDNPSKKRKIDKGGKRQKGKKGKKGFKKKRH